MISYPPPVMLAVHVLQYQDVRVNINQRLTGGVGGAVVRNTLL